MGRFTDKTGAESLTESRPSFGLSFQLCFNQFSDLFWAEFTVMVAAQFQANIKRQAGNVVLM